MSSAGVEPAFPPSEGGVLSVIRRGRLIFAKKPGDPLRYSLARRHRGPGFSGALGRNRTYGLLDRNQTLYPLSYKRECHVFSVLRTDSENRVKYAAIFRECQSYSGHGVPRADVRVGRDESYSDRDRRGGYAHGRRSGPGCGEKAVLRVEDRYE